MVDFLIKRPIAVLMAFLASTVLGIVCYLMLPVSLLPDIAIPQITIQVVAQEMSAKELENTAVARVRRQLLQISNLDGIVSETHDGIGIIKLTLDFGTNTDLAFIEVNEKIDAAMSFLPKSFERPKVIMASATDIPVLYLNLSLKNQKRFQNPDEDAYLNLCNLSENVIRKRIEQLPQVAMVDMTGIPGQQLLIVPDKAKMMMCNVTNQEIENALDENNVVFGSMVVHNGYYEYNVTLLTQLISVEDVQDIYLRKGNHLWQIKDFCTIGTAPRKEKGRSMVMGKRAVSLAIIKQADENMDDLKRELKQITSFFSEKYPDVTFTICRNQTELLDYSISNLQQNLSLGLLLIFIVSFFFLHNMRSPIIIAISMIAAILITFLLFYLFHISLNVISLSGLILAVGMMIDNAIIVTENIGQHRDRGEKLQEACISGTSEMITPMLSSSLTTVAVFVPLVFMSGIAGALFSDQAFAITSGLLGSYIVAIMLLPIIYFSLHQLKVPVWIKRIKTKRADKNHPDRERLDEKIPDNEKANEDSLSRWYTTCLDWMFKHKKMGLITTALTIPLCIFLFWELPKEYMPVIDHDELLIHIDWNERIYIDENNKRVNQLIQTFDDQVLLHTAYIGSQDYLMVGDLKLGSNQTEIYFKVDKPKRISKLEKNIAVWMKKYYPKAIVGFSPPTTIFEKVFDTNKADIVAQVDRRSSNDQMNIKELKTMGLEMGEKAQCFPKDLAVNEQIGLVLDRAKMSVYKVPYSELVRVLETAFRGNQIGVLRSRQSYLPINIGCENQTLAQLLHSGTVKSKPDYRGHQALIPLKELLHVVSRKELKEITASKNGEYIPYVFSKVDDPETVIKKVKEVVKNHPNYDVSFSGSYFASNKMISELAVILLLSILMMYFILSAQFESFLQPLIVLIEIPIDTTFALISLWLCGYSLNLMSAIGIIVTCGIVVNDSILKLDAINELRKSGMPLMEAIHLAGKRRLRAIIMTSLTTIMAMIPLLFTFDMGSELQKPLVVAMVGSMVVGTLVSLYIVPIFYWCLYRKKKETTQISESE